MNKWLMPGCRVVMLLLGFSTHLKAQQEFTVNATLGSDQQGLVRITYFNKSETITDSVNFSDGKFSFRGKIATAGQATIVINPLYGRITYEQYLALDQREFYLSPGVNTIRGTAGLKTANITNGKEQAAFEVMDSLHRHYESRTGELMLSGQRYYEARDSVSLGKVRDSLSALRLESERADSSFIEHYPDCFAAFDLFANRYQTQALSLPSAQTEFERFAPAIRSSYRGKLFAARIEKARRLAPGATAPDIQLLDTTGQLSALGSLRGKYVLVGFWSVHAGSAGAFMQAAKQTRQLLDASLLEIYAVGYAVDWNSWTQTLSRVQPTWINVIDMDGISNKGAQSETARTFDLGVMRLPQGYLISPDGKIVTGGLKFDQHLAQTVQLLISNKQ